MMSVVVKFVSVNVTLAFFVLVVLLSSQPQEYWKVVAYRENCSVTINEADKCAKKLLFEGDRERLVPKNEEELNEHCRIMTDNMKCLERHSKCYRPFPRQIFNMILIHVRSAHKGRCINKAGRAEFLHHMKCIRNPADSEPAHQCLDRWTVQMKLVSDQYSIEDHFPGVCCSFHIMKDCLVKAVLSVCKEATAAESAKYAEKMMLQTFSDFLDLACGRQKNLEDCERTFKEGTRKLIDAVAAGVPAQNGSALFHAIKIVTRHD